MLFILVTFEVSQFFNAESSSKSVHQANISSIIFTLLVSQLANAEIFDNLVKLSNMDVESSFNEILLPEE
jgi:hypothetical protein